MTEYQPLRARGPAGLAELLAALGTRAFGPCLAAYADQLFGGHVCFVYHHRHGNMSALAAGHVPEDPTNVLVPNVWRYTRQREWERDACLSRGMSLIESRRPYATFHDLGGVESRRHWPWTIPTPLIDKTLLCETLQDETFIVEFSRWGETCEFDREAVLQATETGRVVMNLVVLHRRMLMFQREPQSVFRSSAEIDECLSETTGLTPRERQVCALMLRGVGGPKISSELDLKPESVKSYRKRAYLRLGVSGERELALKFLSLRASWRGRRSDLDSPAEPSQMPFLVPANE